MAFNNRYFHFGYFYYIDNDLWGMSTINIESTSFPEEKYLQAVAQASLQKTLNLHPDTKIGVSIQSIHEFRNKQDFEQFIGRKNAKSNITKA